MTVKEKEDNFYKMAIDSATAQNVAMVKEYKEQLEKESEGIKQKVVESVRQETKIEMDRLTRENNTTLSKKSLEARHRYSECVEECREDLFASVKEALLSFTDTEEYQKRLKKQAFEAVSLADQTECVMEVMSKDVTFIKNLGLPAFVKVEEAKEDFIGGMKAVFTKKKMILNETYALRLDEVKRQFQFQVNQTAEV